MNYINLKITDCEEGERLDKLLSLKISDHSRTFIQSLIKKGLVKVNGKIFGNSYRVKSGDIISVKILETYQTDIKPEKIKLDIVYEDQDLLVVNKPKGMVVHPASGVYSGTLVNALLYYYKENLSDINGVIRPGIVHRIDKDTSGLLIVAKNNCAHCNLAMQIKKHSVKREYVAISYGNLKENFGTISAPISRSNKDRKKMAVNYESEKKAVTHYKVLEHYKGFTKISLKLETGRTHQIRVHMAYIGHPIAGDPIYGPKRNVITRLKGQCLHARLIGFEHPTTKEYLELKKEPPAEFISFERELTKNTE